MLKFFGTTKAFRQEHPVTSLSKPAVLCLLSHHRTSHYGKLVNQSQKFSTSVTYLNRWKRLSIKKYLSNIRYFFPFCHFCSPFVVNLVLYPFCAHRFKSLNEFPVAPPVSLLSPENKTIFRGTRAQALVENVFLFYATTALHRSSNKYITVQFL